MTKRENLEKELGFRVPRIGELYVNTGTDRMCVVEGFTNEIPRWRRVKVRYVDNGNAARVHLYRWDMRAVPAQAFPSYPRMLRVYPGVRLRSLKRTIQEARQAGQ